MIQLYQTLDLRPIGIPQTLRLSQYDSDFEIIFELTNFDGAWILDTDTTAEIQGTKTDGHGYSADAVFDDQLKTVTIAGDVQMTAAAGRNTFEVVLFHDGDRLGSKNFILDVERAALDAETTASDSKIKNFTEMVEAAEDAAETATAAAEAAEEAAASMEPSMTDDAKNALLACLRGVAWLDDNGAALYDALEYALFAAVTSITADFVQGSEVFYTNNTLDDLRPYLTVTARYTDGTTEVVTDYTLSGELTVGDSTITASYSGKTATFTVSVTSRRRADLPNTYDQVEYIEGTGTQYIDTGILAQIPLKVNAIISVSQSNGAIATSFQSGGTGRFYIIAYGKFPDQALGVRYGSGGWIYDSSSTPDRNVPIEVESGIESTDSTTAKAYIDYGDSHVEQSLSKPTLGSNVLLNKNDADGTIGSGTKYYAVKFTAGNSILFDGIPSIRKSDNKSGLYDVITETFFISAGTEDFVTGPVVD